MEAQLRLTCESGSKIQESLMSGRSLLVYLKQYNFEKKNVQATIIPIPNAQESLRCDYIETSLQIKYGDHKDGLYCSRPKDLVGSLIKIVQRSAGCKVNVTSQLRMGSVI